jgi:putative transcriptional regulator
MKELKPLPNLIDARKKLSMTQDDLARKAKLSRSMLSNIERGDTLPSLKVAYRIAKTLNSTIEHIFFTRNARKMSKSA